MKTVCVTAALIMAYKVCVNLKSRLKNVTIYVYRSESVSCSLVVDEKRHDKEHLEEATYGADLYGVDSLDGFYQEGNDGEENRGQQSIKQTKAWACL